MDYIINTIQKYLPEILTALVGLFGLSYIVSENSTKKDLPAGLEHYSIYKNMMFLMFFLFLGAVYYFTKTNVIASWLSNTLFIILFVLTILGFVYTF